ncbi:tetratricopeptide repeat protein [Vicingaceae bacterium]|nr:tetratricopeptide repeat protein [Vicingaceae bacterium]
MNRALIISMFAVALTTCSIAACQDLALADNVPDQKRSSDEYYDLGGFHYAVTTESELAQTWFDRGLAMCIAFNHEEAIRCFEKAIEHDPAMPMAYWGLAYAMGPNINNMEIPAETIAQAGIVLHLGKLHSKKANDKEIKLIDALAKRYATPVPELDERITVNRAYTEEMRKLHSEFSDDSLVAALFAESLMLLRPWKHWTKEGKPAEETPEIVSTLEAALKKWPSHPALCHLYIHTMEASPHPEKALPAANRLRNAMPGAGHLVHMPSHIYVLVGDYPKMIDANKKAIEADTEFLRREGPFNFYTLYRIHNYHFVVYGAMFDGQSELAMTTARQLVKQVPEAMLKQQVDFLDAFMPMPLHVMIRFGQWEKILAEPQPADYLPMSRSIWHYARSLAYAATGRVENAEKEQLAFEKSAAAVPETSMLFQNTSRDILGVARAMVAGEIAYRKGEFETAFKNLQEAVRLDDNLNYDEPWGWMQPARHALGALLLEQGRVAEAEAVYREDLKHRPANPWSLFGLAECLAKQSKASESAEVMAQFKAAAKRADIKIDRSCFCKINDLSPENKK